MDSDTRVKVVCRIPPGTEYDFDLVLRLRERYPSVAVRAANLVHDVAALRLGGDKYQGVLTIAQIRELPIAPNLIGVGPRTMEALRWLVDET